MSTPFLSEIKIMSFNFAPKGWALCNGQTLPINQNQALFALLGTTYGGNGQTTFALPNLQGQVPIHQGGGHTLGERSGSEAVTINAQTMPTHLHVASGTNQPHNTNPENYQPLPDNALLAVVNQQYNAVTNVGTLAPSVISNVGGNQPHINMAPYLVLNFCIALQGIFPSQN